MICYVVMFKTVNGGEVGVHEVHVDLWDAEEACQYLNARDEIYVYYLENTLLHGAG